MAHNTRPLQRAQDGIAPQYYNELTDEYEVLQGTAGANHTIIYGPDGKPVAVATDAKLELVRLLLESLDGKEFASETTLGELQLELGLVKVELETIKGMLTDGTAKGKVQLSGKKAQVVYRVYDSTTPVEAGKSEEITIFASTGYVARLTHIGLSTSAIGAGTTGTHRVRMGIGHGADAAPRLFDYSVNAASTLAATPAAREEMRGVLAAHPMISDTTGLVIRYDNDSDTDQLNKRSIRAVLYEMAVV